MASGFLDEFHARAKLSAEEFAILASVDVRSDEDVASLLFSYPSMAKAGLRFPQISSAAQPRLSSTFMRTAHRMAERRPAFAMGAQAPPGAAFGLQSSIPIPEQAPGKSLLAAFVAPQMDLRRKHWPVRNQYERQTSVAFGAAACAEHRLMGAADDELDLSEQFLYWSIKTRSPDPNRTQDGTRLEYAADVLPVHGICEKDFWPYVPTPVNPVSGETSTDPTRHAIADAAGRLFLANHHANPRNAANLVRRQLANGTVVAICLPVFGDPLMPDGPTNWDTVVAMAYGRVLNPPPGSICVAGHCVCVTGFVPDSREQKGGYFIVRNSWGIDWAHNAPDPSHSHAPERGYGEVSASYINNFCWELMHL
jgi:hypothetical protein